jgi:undecaprenyl-diphosphatase
MEWIQVIFLAAIQGVIEFLPISSSGHLALFPAIFGWEDQGLVFDVAVHLGSLIAILFYFRQDISRIFYSQTPSAPNPYRREALLVILGTIPILIIGYLLSDELLNALRSPVMIASATAFFGVILWWSDVSFSNVKVIKNISLKEVLFIGLMQAVAVVPGTSRSGITITAARILGIDRIEAARFSFLLAIPAIAASAVWQAFGLIGQTHIIEWDKILVAILLSCLFSWLTIYFFLKFIQAIKFSWFMSYRLLVAALVFMLL